MLFTANNRKSFLAAEGNRTLRIVILDDDADNRRLIRESIDEILPGSDVVKTDNILDASNVAGGIDVLIVDISAVANLWQIDHAYHSICSFIAKHPGATVIINTAIAHPDDVKDDILEQMPEAHVLVCDWATGDLEKHLANLQ